MHSFPIALHSGRETNRSDAGRNPLFQPCVYLMASKRNGTLYVGVTYNLVQRVWQHKSDLSEGFTKQYGVHLLVWYEVHPTMESAITREKAIKGWKRVWKLALIEGSNSAWRDLYDTLC
ncbi:MAG: GIY-YIG nuclease family protein [SAR202 cluster bacterium]|nr:GIY-YIG nuclease family protein [SAR202 cluster bacterium]